MDLCLIIDSSGSVRDNNPPSGSPDNWQLQLDFFSNLVAAYPIGQDDTRVAAIVFSEQVILEFTLNQYNSLSQVQEAIRNIPYLAQTTNTPEALYQADLQCFSAANGDRPDADNMIIIGTDGNPFPELRKAPALRVARDLLNKGVKIASIGVTDNVDEDFLQALSFEDY